MLCYAISLHLSRWSLHFPLQFFRRVFLLFNHPAFVRLYWMVELCFLERGTEPRASKQPKGIDIMKRHHSQEELFVDCNHSTGHEASGQRLVCDQDAPMQNPGSSSSAVIGSAVSPSDKGTRCPSDFVPDAECLEFALLLCPELDLEQELVSFRKHWCSISGRGALKCDWNAMFRRWLRKSQAFVEERRHSRRTIAIIRSV
ncbi:hypothetical protein BH18ACI4_BH18ACI4_06190 [soil metagenome]